MNTLTTNIGPEYVSNWGLPEALREIISNALDVKTQHDVELSFEWQDGYAIIQDNGPGLEMRHLVLGCHASGDDAIGQWGEGLKLAMAICARKGHDMRVYSNGKQICPIYMYSPEYGAEVLAFEVESYPTATGTRIVVECAEEDFIWACQQFVALTEMGYGPPNFQWVVLGSISLPGGYIYINGLQAGKLPKEALFSYHLPKGQAPINRDRTLVDMYAATPIIRKLLACADDETISWLMRAAAKLEPVWELDNAPDYWNIPESRRGRWLELAKEVFGENAVLCDVRQVPEVRARGATPALVPYNWRYLLNQLGLPTFSDLVSKRPVVMCVGLGSLTPSEREVYEQAMRCLRRRNLGLEPVDIAESIVGVYSERPDSTYDKMVGVIYIARQALVDLRRATKALLYALVQKKSVSTEGSDQVETVLEVALQLLGM